MPRTTGKLNPKTVSGALKPGRHSDGGNLYLLVEKAGARRWLFIYRWDGRQREMGLGSASDVTLAKAREKAAAARAQLAEGVDPLAAKAARTAAKTFGEFSDEVLATLLPGFSNAKHRQQWEMTLRHHAAPLRDKPIDAIVTQDVVEALRPIWTTVPETADRTRQRIERILDAAEASGLRPGGLRNPASWKGNLKHLLPARRKLSRGHHAAMPYAAVPAFVAELRKRENLSAWALEFTILTAARTSEVIKATWDEIDLEARVWEVPADHMKQRRPHRVPLSERAVSLLAALRPYSADGFIFSFGRGKAMSNMAMTMLVRGMAGHYVRLAAEHRPVTVHGFRSAFRDWAGTETEYPRELAEEALSHLVGNAVERAYRRGDALERRRVMMENWSMFVGSGTSVLAPSKFPEAAAA
jgi:integrase